MERGYHYRRRRRHVDHPSSSLDIVLVIVLVIGVVVSTIVLAVVEAVGRGASFIVVNGGGINRRPRRRPTSQIDHRDVVAVRPPVGMTPIDDDYENDTLPLKSTSELHRIRAGFVGCGTIAYSIASGLANPRHSSHLANEGLMLSSISVTRRSISKSSLLKDDYPDVVTVYETAMEVVSNCDVVFLCVLPHQVDGVLMELADGGTWRREDHTLVSLVVSYYVWIYFAFVPPGLNPRAHCIMLNIYLRVDLPLSLEKCSRRARSRT